MADETIHSHDERVRVLRDKARREGIVLPDEVADYLANKFGIVQTLKGALVRLHTTAFVKQVEIDLAFAQEMFADHDDLFEPEVAAEPQSQPELEPEPTPEPEPVQQWTRSPEPAPAPEPAPEPEPAPGVAPEPAPVAHAEPESEPLGGLFALEPEPEPTPGPGPVTAPHTAPAPAATPVAAAPAPLPVVWFAPMRSVKKLSLVMRAGTLLARAGLKSAIDEGDLVAIKLHFGEEGNTGFVQPVFLREVVRCVRESGGKPFLTDANTLYRGKRFNAVEHLECALHNGFSYATVDAPLIIADGLDGRDAVDVPIEGFDHFESVRIGSAAVHADAMVVVTHVKGHEATGFGGALKNVGMGLGCRSAKQRMHADFKPEVTAEKCTACKRCVQWCPVQAIVIGPDRVATIDYETCYGCGECVAACPFGAIAADWKTTPEAIQEKIVEHVAGAVADKAGKVVYLSFVTNVSPDCDCWSFSDASVVADIGVLASTDIVAIDQAAYDLIVSANGLPGGLGEGMGAGTDKFTAITGIDGTHAMRYAEKHGLGSRTYDLRTME